MPIAGTRQDKEILRPLKNRKNLRSGKTQFEIYRESCTLKKNFNRPVFTFLGRSRMPLSFWSESHGNIAFGFFKSYGLLFVFISLVAIILFSFYLYRHRHHEHLRLVEVFAFSLVISGAIGNLIDRLSFGYVVDFIDFRFWPVFNVADSAITIGTIIILIKCIPSFSK